MKSLKKPLLVGCILALAGLNACSTTTQQGKYEPKANWTSSFLSRVVGGQTVPDGVNNWQCEPAAGQNPVVLVHGTFSSAMYSFGALGPALANESLCVFSVDYGAGKPNDWFKGVGPVDESAHHISEFVDSVKTATGSSKITLVGHSQGGLIGFYYLKMLQGADHVDRFIALAPSVNGTSIAKPRNAKPWNIASPVPTNTLNQSYFAHCKKDKSPCPAWPIAYWLPKMIWSCCPLKNSLYKNPACKTFIFRMYCQASVFRTAACFTTATH